jgi:hypothetical protein
MSLASRISYLFGLPSSSTAQRQNQDIYNLVDDGQSGTKFEGLDAFGERTTGSDTMAQEEIEEEGRPPYLHVSHSSNFHPTFLLTTGIGHDRRWYWRYNG